METGLFLSETGEVVISPRSTTEQSYMYWRCYLTWPAFRWWAYCSFIRLLGTGQFSIGYLHDQRDKWRCLSGALWQHNSSCFLLVLKGRVKRNAILYLAKSAWLYQIRGMFECDHKLKVSPGNDTWGYLLGLWFEYYVVRISNCGQPGKEFSKVWFDKCIKIFFLKQNLETNTLKPYTMSEVYILGCCLEYIIYGIKLTTIVLFELYSCVIKHICCLLSFTVLLGTEPSIMHAKQELYHCVIPQNLWPCL